MRLPDSFFEGKNRILDLGGWYIPELRATHVVDYLPWETREAKLNLKPLPGERFSKDTWFQADFLDPNLRLPFADKSFDLVLCGHTVEDLAAPQNLLNEMQRIAVQGVVECPSRLTEQTIGMRDRMSRLPGHPHHHWIVESNEGELVLFSKSDSLLTSASRMIPLTFSEAFRHSNPNSDIVAHHWTESLRYRLAGPSECASRAGQFVREQHISTTERWRDSALRLARRIRARLRGKGKEDFSWWKDILEKSRPYSTLPLS
jgi:SAM-dependent methyltransferase